MNQQPILKKHKRYIIYRYYCLSAFLIWNISYFYLMFPYFSHKVKEFPIFMIVLIPLTIPALLMFFTLFAFPFNYSLFGKYERNNFPSGQPILIKSTSVGLGYFYSSRTGVKIHIFNNGVGFSILGIGKIFIEFNEIKEIKKSILSYKIIHSNKQVYSPIFFRKKKIYIELNSMFQKFKFGSMEYRTAYNTP